jgi:regulator of nucleoside diphosphate kinase
MHLLDNLPLTNPEILVLDDEHELLSDLVCASVRPTPGISLLWSELKRAKVVPASAAPADLVRMESCVEYTDVTSRESRVVRLVAPKEAVSAHRISATSSLGAALLGLRPGHSFRWYGPDGDLRIVRVDEVTPPLGVRDTRVKDAA